MRALIAAGDEDDWGKVQTEYRANYMQVKQQVRDVLTAPVAKVFGTIGGAKLKVWKKVGEAE